MYGNTLADFAMVKETFQDWECMLWYWFGCDTALETFVLLGLVDRGVQ